MRQRKTTSYRSKLFFQSQGNYLHNTIMPRLSKRRISVVTIVLAGMGICVFLSLMGTVTFDSNSFLLFESNEIESCEELMKRPMYKDGSFLSMKTTEVVWKIRPDKSRELTLPSTCRLKRYTAEQAGACLKNKSLFLVGDSLTRYQFMSLAYFFEHKRWPMRFQAKLQPCEDHIDENGNKTCSKTDEPNVCSEGDWLFLGGWPAYYQAVGGGTDGNLFRGRMESQSHRITGRTSKTVDNSQYISSEESGRTKLNCLMELGKSGMEPMRGFNFTGCSYNASCRYTPERYKNLEQRISAVDFDWNYENIMSTFQNGTQFQSQHENTNYIFYNRGIWGLLQKEKAKTMMSSMYQMIGGDTGIQASNRCFFKSTTGAQTTRKLYNWESGPVRNVTLEAGCEYFDVAHVTEEFSRIGEDDPDFKNVFWDRVHYAPWVYEEINNLMLNLLCNAHQVAE